MSRYFMILRQYYRFRQQLNIIHTCALLPRHVRVDPAQLLLSIIFYLSNSFILDHWNLFIGPNIFIFPSFSSASYHQFCTHLLLHFCYALEVTPLPPLCIRLLGQGACCSMHQDNRVDEVMRRPTSNSGWLPIKAIPDKSFRTVLSMIYDNLVPIFLPFACLFLLFCLLLTIAKILLS